MWQLSTFAPSIDASGRGRQCGHPQQRRRALLGLRPAFARPAPRKKAGGVAGIGGLAWLGAQVAVWVGAPPILVYFSGDWGVHWGYGILTHGHVAFGGCLFGSQVRQPGPNWNGSSFERLDPPP